MKSDVYCCDSITIVLRKKPVQSKYLSLVIYIYIYIYIVVCRQIV